MQSDRPKHQILHSCSLCSLWNRLAVQMPLHMMGEFRTMRPCRKEFAVGQRPHSKAPTRCRLTSPSNLLARLLTPSVTSFRVVCWRGSVVAPARIFFIGKSLSQVGRFVASIPSLAIRVVSSQKKTLPVEAAGIAQHNRPFLA